MADRIEKRRALQAAVEAYGAKQPVPEHLRETTAKVVRTAGELCDVIGRISTDTAIRWTIELALDAFTQDQVEEAARHAARTMPPQDISLSALLTQARILRERDKAIADIATAAVPRLSDPDLVGGRRNGIVMGGVMSDFTSGLITAVKIKDEFEMRRSMTDEQIEARHSELGGVQAEAEPTSRERLADQRRDELRAQAAALEGA